jgi:hypothetical protein
MKQRIRELLAERLELQVPEGVELLRTGEIARYLRISRDALGEWRRNGGGPPFVKLSHQTVRYPRRGLVRFMREHLHGGILAQRKQRGAGVALPAHRA